MSGISTKSIWKSAKLRRQSHYTAEVSNLNARNLQLDFLSGSLSLVYSVWHNLTFFLKVRTKTHKWDSIYKNANRFLFSYRCMYRQPVGRTLRKLNRTPPQLQCLQIEIIILGPWKKHINMLQAFFIVLIILDKFYQLDIQFWSPCKFVWSLGCWIWR